MTMLFLLLLIVVISFFGVFYSTYYIFGRKDFIKGHDLSEEEYTCIKECGLIHYTNINKLKKF